jgi:hypothetical protein
MTDQDLTLKATCAYEQLTGFARDNAKIAAAYYKSLRAEDVPFAAAIPLTIAYWRGHGVNPNREVAT